MRCGLLGRTLSHSHSPLLHSLLGSYDYALFEIPPEQVEDFLRSGPWDGLNVTIPYKRTAYALCDSLSPAAREAGNVNTLLCRPDGSLYGDNTDAFGFSYLLEKSGISVAGREVLVLGTGGAALSMWRVPPARALALRWCWNFPLMPKQIRCQRHRCSRRKRKKLLLCPA